MIKEPEYTPYSHRSLQRGPIPFLMPLSIPELLESDGVSGCSFRELIDRKLMATSTSDASTAARRNVYVFGTVSFFNDTASEMAYWILPAFLASLGAGPAAMGLIEGVAESVASLGKLFSGYLTDTVQRRKPIVVFGYLLANLVKPLLALSTRWWQVLFIRFADRTAKGLRGTPRDVMLAESVDRKRIGSTYGLLQSMDSAGAIAGPLIAWLIMARTG